MKFSRNISITIICIILGIMLSWQLTKSPGDASPSAVVREASPNCLLLRATNHLCMHARRNSP